MKNQLLKFILKNVLSWIIIMLSMTLTWLLLVYAAVVFPWKVNNWEVLNASTINNIIDNLFWKSDISWNISYTWWNVWIWTTPSEKLDLWWGNIKMWYEVITNTCLNIHNCSAVCSPWKYVLWWWWQCPSSSLAPNYVSLPITWNNWWYIAVAQSCSTLYVYAICANIR
jgi:hypothetical protein